MTKTPTPEQLRQTLAEAKSGVIRKQDLPRVMFALRFTAKMMEEPSEGMVTEGQYAYQEAGERDGDYNTYDTAQFKAMRDQAIKEIETDNLSPSMMKAHRKAHTHEYDTSKYEIEEKK